MQSIRIILVDDHDILRKGLALFLRSFEGFELVGEASTGEEAVALCEQVCADILLMDVRMPDMDGIAATKFLSQKYPHIKIIALSSFVSRDLVQAMLSAGATSYLLKNMTTQELADAICMTHIAGQVLAPEIQAVMDKKMGYA